MTTFKSKIVNPSRLNNLAIQGFTLLELLITLSIISILIVVVTPSFTASSAKANASAVIQTLSGLVRTARNHAIYHQQTTIMCPSKDGIKCHQTWQDGALIFQDSNANKRLDPSEPVIRFQTPLSDNGSIRWTALRNYIMFSGQGLTGTTAGSFIYCPADNNSEHAHALIISFSGKIRHAQDADQDGIRESGNTKNIICS